MYSILSKKKFQAVTGKLKRIVGEEPTLDFTGYDHPLFEKTARMHQEEYDEHVKESKARAATYAGSIGGKDVSLLGKQFVLMDRQNWLMFKEAKRFLERFHEKESEMDELNLNLSESFGIEQGHIHLGYS
jgi:hypothetical protein